MTTETPAGMGETGVLPRVLVIEDNRDAADTLRRLLQRAGYDVAVAYSGPDGLESARARLPAIVICDLAMPGMDGYEIARALRNDAATATMRLIAVSGYAMAEDQSQCLRAGFDHHLPKPFNMSDLITLMRSN
jgi:CheY-like chemotaxis protein